MIRSQKLRGISQTSSGKWNAKISINGRPKHLGCFAIKEQAAAAYDRSARLNHMIPSCNYDSPEDAELAIRAASEYNGLLHLGQINGAHYGGLWSSKA
jgi:hypothetical protein